MIEVGHSICAIRSTGGINEGFGDKGSIFDNGAFGGVIWEVVGRKEGDVGVCGFWVCVRGVSDYEVWGIRIEE